MFQFFEAQGSFVVDLFVFDDIPRLATRVIVAAVAPTAALATNGTPFIPIDCAIANPDPAPTAPIEA